MVWPESPAPFEEDDPRFQHALIAIARQSQAPLVVGNVGMDYSAENQAWREYNSALVVGADGARIGRYDKIHLVPFGEYVPFQKLLFFARKLTGRVSAFDRGEERKVFRLNGHRYGIFICYEAVFADEVREFSQLGAEVLVNISDDGWYGDTSAPWQHLNMARMRAIENRRWLLRDTNNGVTAAIDPYGRVRQSIPRHQVDALAGGVWVSRRRDLLHRAWRRVCVGMCHTGYRAGGLVCPDKSPPQNSWQSQVLRAKHVIERSRIRLRSRARSSPRPAGVSLTLLASAGNSPT